MLVQFSLEAIRSAASSALPAYLGTYAAAWQSRQICPACSPNISFSCPACPAVHCHCGGNSTWNRAEPCLEVPAGPGLGLQVTLLFGLVVGVIGFAFGCCLGASLSRRFRPRGREDTLRAVEASTGAAVPRKLPPAPVPEKAASRQLALPSESQRVGPAAPALEDAVWKPRARR